MEAISAEFKSVLGEIHQDLEDANIRDNWDPPCSFAGIPYVALLTGLKTGAKVDERTSKKYVWIKLDFTIQEGEYADKEFSVFFNSRLAFTLGPIFGLAMNLGGSPDLLANKDLLGVVETIEGSVDSAIIEVLGKIRKDKQGREWPEFSFPRVLENVSA